MPNYPNSPNDPEIYILPEALSNLPNGVLFYPCSGRDYDVPIQTFADYVEDLWFSDISYLKGNNILNDEYNHKELDSVKIKSLRNRAIRNNRYSERGNTILERCYIEKLDDFLPNRKKVGTMIWKSKASEKNPSINRRRWINPLILTDTYQHRTTLKLNHIHRRRGFGQDCLSKHDFEKISVFFYRGDSPGEGGSGVRWLGRYCRLTKMLLDRMDAGALIVTDNSNTYNCWRGKATIIAGIPLEQQIGKEFTFLSRKFRLVGNVGQRYDHTLVWQLQD